MSTFARMRLDDWRWAAPYDITADTYPDRVYGGEIVYISDEAEFTPSNVQTTEERVKLVYEVRVRITQDEALDLKPGIAADVVLDKYGVSTPTRAGSSCVGAIAGFWRRRGRDRIDLRHHGAGELFGLVGPDGAGKTTTLTHAWRASLPPSDGRRVGQRHQRCHGPGGGQTSHRLHVATIWTCTRTSPLKKTSTSTLTCTWFRGLNDRHASSVCTRFPILDRLRVGWPATSRVA